MDSVGNTIEAMLLLRNIYRISDDITVDTRH